MSAVFELQFGYIWGHFRSCRIDFGVSWLLQQPGGPQGAGGSSVGDITCACLLQLRALASAFFPFFVLGYSLDLAHLREVVTRTMFSYSKSEGLL